MTFVLSINILELSKMKNTFLRKVPLEFPPKLPHSFSFFQNKKSGICSVENEQNMECFTAVKKFEVDVCVSTQRETKDTLMSKEMQAAARMNWDYFKKQQQK